MNYLMIHDVRKEYFNLNLNPYRLTFDDGLFSQYYYFPLFKNHPQKLYYFIVTSFIKPGKAREMFNGTYGVNLKPTQYMYRTFVEGNYDHFMTVAEIQELCAHPNVRIGVHSHFHDVILTRQHPRKRKPLSQWKLNDSETLRKSQQKISVFVRGSPFRDLTITTVPCNGARKRNGRTTSNTIRKCA